MPEPRRWTLYDESEDYNPRWVIGDGTPPPALSYAETVEVMPVSEHEEAVTRLELIAHEQREHPARLAITAEQVERAARWLHGEYHYALDWKQDPDWEALDTRDVNGWRADAREFLAAALGEDTTTKEGDVHDGL